MNAGTLKGKICRHCEKIFKRGTTSIVNTDYCANCHVVGWQDEMYRAGCSVVNPKNLGKQCHLVKVKFKDCPKVAVKGEMYRDITELLYEDTKYKKTYPTDKEWKKIRGYQFRKARVRDFERRRCESFTEEDARKTIEMRKNGKKHREIAEALSKPLGTISRELTVFKKEGLLE